MYNDRYFYFRTVADQDADDGIDDSICVPVRTIRSIAPSSDTALTITFDSVYNTMSHDDDEVVIADTVILNVNQGKTEQVMQCLVQAMKSNYPLYQDGFIVIADDVVTTYVGDKVVPATYIHDDITSCGAIGIATQLS